MAVVSFNERRPSISVMFAVVVLLGPSLILLDAPVAAASFFDVDTIPYSLGEPAGTVWTGKEVFLFGGFGAPPVLRYEPETRKLDGMKATFMNGDRSATAAVWTGTHAYIFGGQNRNSIALSDIYRYDPAADKLELMNARLPSGRGWMGAIWTGEVAYIFGGSWSHPDLGTFHGEIFRYDPRTDKLREPGGSGKPLSPVEMLPKALSRMAAVWDGQAAYLLGGVVGGHSHVATAEIVRFDPVTNKAVTLPHVLPLSLGATSGVWTGSAIYVFGGYSGNGNGPQSQSAIVQFIPESGKAPLLLADRLPTPARHRTSAVFDETAKKALIFGGVSSTCSCDLQEIVRYDAPLPPSEPKELKVHPRADGAVTLTWLPPQFLNRPLEGYRLYRGFSPETATVFANLSDQSLEYRDSSVTPGLKYFYKLAAHNLGGESANDYVGAWPLSPVQGLTALYQAPRGEDDPGVVHLTWERPVGDLLGILFYRIEQKTSLEQQFRCAGALNTPTGCGWWLHKHPEQSFVFSESNLTPPAVYEYKVTPIVMRSLPIPFFPTLVEYGVPASVRVWAEPAPAVPEIQVASMLPAAAPTVVRDALDGLEVPQPPEEVRSELPFFCSRPGDCQLLAPAVSQDVDSNGDGVKDGKDGKLNFTILKAVPTPPPLPAAFPVLPNPSLPPMVGNIVNNLNVQGAVATANGLLHETAVSEAPFDLYKIGLSSPAGRAIVVQGYVQVGSLLLGLDSPSFQGELALKMGTDEAADHSFVSITKPDDTRPNLTISLAQQPAFHASVSLTGISGKASLWVNLSQAEGEENKRPRFEYSAERPLGLSASVRLGSVESINDQFSVDVELPEGRTQVDVEPMKGGPNNGPEDCLYNHVAMDGEKVRVSLPAGVNRLALLLAKWKARGEEPPIELSVLGASLGKLPKGQSEVIVGFHEEPVSDDKDFDVCVTSRLQADLEPVMVVKRWAAAEGLQHDGALRVLIPRFPASVDVSYQSRTLSTAPYVKNQVLNITAADAQGKGRPVTAVQIQLRPSAGETSLDLIDSEGLDLPAKLYLRLTDRLESACVPQALPSLSPYVANTSELSQYSHQLGGEKVKVLIHKPPEAVAAQLTSCEDSGEIAYHFVYKASKAPSLVELESGWGQGEGARTLHASIANLPPAGSFDVALGKQGAIAGSLEASYHSAIVPSKAAAIKVSYGEPKMQVDGQIGDLGTSADLRYAWFSDNLEFKLQSGGSKLDASVTVTSIEPTCGKPSYGRKIVSIQDVFGVFRLKAKPAPVNICEVEGYLVPIVGANQIEIVNFDAGEFRIDIQDCDPTLSRCETKMKDCNQFVQEECNLWLTWELDGTGWPDERTNNLFLCISDVSKNRGLNTFIIDPHRVEDPMKDQECAPWW